MILNMNNYCVELFKASRSIGYTRLHSDESRNAKYVMYYVIS